MDEVIREFSLKAGGKSLIGDNLTYHGFEAINNVTPSYQKSHYIRAIKSSICCASTYYHDANQIKTNFLKIINH